MHCVVRIGRRPPSGRKWSVSESRYFGRQFVVFGRLPDIDTG
ncbi:MAG: hypothetical protein WBM78_00880 [Desulfobacterales bacterium]